MIADFGIGFLIGGGAAVRIGCRSRTDRADRLDQFWKSLTRFIGDFGVAKHDNEDRDDGFGPYLCEQTKQVCNPARDKCRCWWISENPEHWSRLARIKLGLSENQSVT